MSLIIKGVDMPKSCESMTYFSKEIIEIPSRHGRLIDADDAIYRLKHLYCDGCGYDCSTCQWGAFIKYLDCRPTIIEAEVSE